MMKKVRFSIITILIIGIIAGIVAPVYAGDAEETDELNVNEISPDELNELDELELVPVPEKGKNVKIDGGFQGVWNSNTSTEARPGTVAGIYGRVECADDCSYGYFGGLWKNSSGRMAGYLKGRYRDGYFRGIWRCLETDMWGPVIGKYYPVPNPSSNEICHYFVGKWATIDGNLNGYLRGTWSPLAEVKPEGRFNGQWMYDNQLTAASINPDGRLAGTYGVGIFQDGTTIHYFRGKWGSNDGERGRLGGLVVDSMFGGVWNSDDNLPQGYLKGTWRNNRFKGVWGHFCQGTEGRLWGTYRPFPTPKPEPVEAIPIPKELRALPSVVK